MPNCISSSTSIAAITLEDDSETGPDYEVVVTAITSPLTLTITPPSGESITTCSITNPPSPGNGSAPATSINAADEGTVTFSTSDGTPSGGVSYWILELGWSGESMASTASSGGPPVTDAPTKNPKFQPVSQCSQ